MLLALDVGNTNITVGAFEGKKLKSQWRLVTDSRSIKFELNSSVKRNKVVPSAVVYGSVVPSLNKSIEASVARGFGVRALRIDAKSKLGMQLKVKRPSEVGADRILNAVAAFELLKGPAVVLDFGTATTFDCVAKNGDYLGGAILPGPRMAAKALELGTAQLPMVEIRKPRRVIGKDTVECIEAGLYYGYLGMIEKVLELTLKEMRQSGQGNKVRVLATGGLSSLFKNDLPRSFAFEPDLTLTGLRIAFERLEPRSC